MKDNKDNVKLMPQSERHCGLDPKGNNGKTLFSPYFTNKTTLVASMHPPQSQPYYLIKTRKNEVMRSKMGGYPFSTEVGLLKKLGRNAENNKGIRAEAKGGAILLRETFENKGANNQTSNLKLQTSNLKLQTSNLKPQTPNPKPLIFLTQFLIF